MIIPMWYKMKHTDSIPYDIDWTLNQLVRFGPRWKNEQAMGCPLNFEELIISFSAPDDNYYLGTPDKYHDEEIVVLAIRRMHKRWSDGKNPLMEAFNKVTVVTQEYEQSFMITEEDRKSVQGLLCWMVDVCSRRVSNGGDHAFATRACSS